MTKTDERRALVIGAGIAGTVAAMALRKAGFEPVVLESYGRGADGVGAFLSLATNGLSALSAIDLVPSDIGGFDTPKIALFLGDGSAIAELPLGPARADGLACRTIARAELYGALRDEAVRRGIRIEYDKRLVEVETSPDGVRARFADGSEEVGDLLVGADGLASRVREIIDPRAPRARYVGLLNTGGYARGITVPGEVGTMQMIFGKRSFFCYVPHPSGEVWWFANPGRANEPSRAELAAITPEAWRAELLALFAGDATPATEIIGATDTILGPWGTYDFATVPTWHRDRMIIIGDAAHAASPSSGQGASMAIEDAIVLAMCLRDAPDVAEAFRAYEQLRRARVERVVKQGRRNGSGKTPGLFGRVVRDTFLRFVFARIAKSGRDPMAWVYDYALDWDGSVLRDTRAA